MPENNFINVLDFDDCIIKSVLMKKKSSDGSVASKSTKNTSNESNKESESLNIIENSICNKPCKFQDTDNMHEQAKSIKSDSEIVISNITEYISNNEEKEETHPNNTDNSLERPNDGMLSADIDSPRTIVESDELLNRISPKSLKVDNYDIGKDRNSESGSDYHSSDFEFITESEAGLEGLIDNRNKKRTNNRNSSELSGSSSFSGCFIPNLISDRGNYFDSFKENNQTSRNCDKDKEANRMNLIQLGPSCSNISRNNHIDSSGPSTSYSSEPHRNTYDFKPRLHNLRIDQPVHNAIPAGEEYLNLFRGIYDPLLTVSSIHMMENKSFRATGMNVEFEGIGFDVRIMRNMDGSSQDEFESEAEENVMKIVNMYPGDNRKRRRRQ